MAYDADVIVVGAGLAGLVARRELPDAGRKVLVLDHEPEASLGGQAFWSSAACSSSTPEPRGGASRTPTRSRGRTGSGTAGFDRDEDHWPREWAEAYVDFACGEKRVVPRGGGRWSPIVGWAERGGYGAIGYGNLVPRFHVTWGTGPSVLEPFVRRVREAPRQGCVDLRFRHRADDLGAGLGMSLAPHR